MAVTRDDWMDNFLLKNPDITGLLSRLSDSDLSVGIAIGIEANRLSEKYGKDTFNADDLTVVLGVGLNNVRELMNRPDFPTLKIGNRRVIVSSLGLSAWFLKGYLE